MTVMKTIANWAFRRLLKPQRQWWCLRWAVVGAVLSSVSAVQATSFIWTNSSGSWQTNANWFLPSASPGAGDGAFFTNNTAYTVTLDASVSDLASNYFNGAGNVTFNLGANTLSVTNRLGQNNGVGAFVVGFAAGSTPTVYLSSAAGGGLMITNAANDSRFIIGGNGVGTLFVTNGQVIANLTVMGDTSTGQGTLVLAGSSTWWTNSSTFRLGNATGSTGNSLVISNSASMTIVSDFLIGTNRSGGNSVLLETGGQLFTRAGVIIGGGTSNNLVTIQRSGGSAPLWDLGGQSLLIGTRAATGNVLRIDGVGVAVTNASALNIGGAAASISNSLILSGGGLLITGAGTIGAGGIGNSVTITGSGSTWTNSGALILGGANSSSGNQLFIGNTAVVVSASGYIGGNTGFTVSGAASNSVIVTDGAVWTNQGGLYVGHTRDGMGNQLTISAGGKVFNNTATIAGDGNSFNVAGTTFQNNIVTVTDTGSLWRINGALILGTGRPGVNGVFGNGVIVSNGAVADNVGNNVNIGGGSGAASNNFIVVTGPGSVWTNIGILGLGMSSGSSSNRLTISAGGAVFSASGTIGASSTMGQIVTVTGTGSLWNISGRLGIGFSGNAGGNQLIISNGGVVNMTNDFLSMGYDAPGPSNNALIITGHGSVLTNIGSSTTAVILLGGHPTQGGGGSNTIHVRDGGLLYVRNSGGALGVTLGSAATGSAGRNLVVVEGADSLLDASGKSIRLGENANAGAGFNTLTVSNGGALLSGAFVVGNASGNNTFNAGGLGLLSYVTNGAVTVGAAAGVNTNTLIITNANVQATSLTVGSAGATNNTALILAGGLLEANTLATGNAGAGNTITNRGGVFQFTSTTITVTTNGGIGSIAINNGTLSFRGITVNLTNNWRGSGLTNMAWVGNNTLRLNNATATNTLAGGYTFAIANPTNYFQLELINGTTAVTGNGITIGATGAMLVSNTTATISGAFTNSGSLSFVNARAAFQSRVYNSGTNTMLNSIGTFNTGVINAGHWLTDPTTNIFQGFGYTNTSSGGITMTAGDVYVFTNTAAGTPANFINVSTNHLANDLTAGKFLFSGGLGLTQALTVAGHDLGPATATATNLAVAFSSAPGYGNNFALGTLEISNFSTVRVTDAFLELGTNDFLMAGLYLENLFLGANSLLIIATNVQVYFKNSNNWSLANIRLENNQASLFGGDAHDYNNEISGLHQIVIVPEPNVLLLLLGGGVTLWATHRRGRRR